MAECTPHNSNRQHCLKPPACVRQGALAALVCFSTLAVLSAPALGAKELRWKMAPGEKFRLVFDQKISSQTAVGAKSTTIVIEMTLEMDWQVESADDDATRLKQSFTRARLKISAPGQDAIEYDSVSAAKPSGAALGIEKAVRPLLGAEFTVVVDPRGIVTDASLSDQAAAALEQSPAAPEIKKLFSPDEVGKILRQAMIVLPPGPVEVNDSWMHESESPSPLGPVKQSTTYTLLAPETRDGRKLEKIGAGVEVSFAPAASGQEQQTKLSQQSQSGVIYFDAAAGRLVESQMTRSTVTETPYRDLMIRVQVDGELRARLSTLPEAP